MKRHDSKNLEALHLPVKKAIIPAAGLGTRLLTATKELPKKMLSVFVRGVNGEIALKPVVQLIFEQLFDSGIRDFYFVVGRGKRAMEDHFTPILALSPFSRHTGRKHRTSSCDNSTNACTSRLSHG